MKRNTIIVLLIVSLVLFSMIAIGSAEENSPCQDVDDNGVNDSETTNEMRCISEGTTFDQLGDIGWAVEGK